jgi:ACS family hexuronate transporter-like MFS transporter
VTSQPSPADEVAGSIVTRIGNYRWTICALLLFATTINYVDRQVISYLKEFFCRSTALGGFGWSNKDFSYLTSAFTGVYALTTVFSGRLIDRIGTKLGLAGSLIVWSVFGMANALAGAAVAAHVAVRSFFAIGEAGNFPASNRIVAEWFPKKERALAIGIFNSGANIGAMIAALFVPWCMLFFGDQLGWKMAFVITGAAGFLWLIFWFWLYETPKNQPRLSKPEYDYIHMDDVGAQNTGRQHVAWSRLLRYRQTWSFVAGKAFTDGIWWFYLFWLPDYLIKQFNMAPAAVRWPTFIVYGISIVGSVYGGSVPMTLINRGMEVYKARMTAMLLIALCPLAVLSTQYFANPQRYGTNALYFAVGIIGLGAAAHQAWSANLYTTVSDMFPKSAVASITGIGTMAGGVGGVLVQLAVGSLRDHFRDAPQTAYLIMFFFCALAYVCAWTVMKALVPRYQLVTDL